MATPREIRTLAFQTLYQIDARSGGDLDDARALVDEDESLSDAERERVLALACAAWENRAEADAAMLELAPEWPAHRQPVVDRAILRLAHYEITRGSAPPKAVINEAVELARAYSTERSPAFVNALLDKIMKRARAGATPAEES
jgi:transcription antitermination protein NusB